MAKQKMFDNSRFCFIGGLSHGNEPLSVKKMGESAWYKTRLGVSVRDDKNSPYLTMENIHKDMIEKETKLMTNEKDENGEKIYITVPSQDTTKEEILKRIPDFMKVTIDLETDQDKKKEYTSLIFKKRNHEIENNNLRKQETLSDEEKAKIEENNIKIAEYEDQIKELAVNRKDLLMKDAIELLNKALPVLKDKKVKITGQPKCNFYNGKNQLQYIPSMIEIVPNETPNQLKLYMDVFYSKDDIEDDKKERKMYINGYVGEVKGGQDKLFPVTLTLDYTKVHDEVEIEKALLDYQRSMFATKNKKMYYRNNVEINVIDGAETVEFDENCLTEAQKMQVKLGLAKPEKFKPRGNIYGDRIQELKFFRATLTGIFTEGGVEAFEKDSLLDFLYQDDSNVKTEDVKIKTTTKQDNKEESKEENSNTNDLMAKLFS